MAADTPSRQHFLILAGALILALLATAQLSFNTRWQSDMTAFMPRGNDGALGQLNRTLQEGPAARIWLLALQGGSEQQRIDASRALAQRLRSSADFSRVLNGEMASGDNSRALLARYRYLLDDRLDSDGLSAETLQRQLQQRLDELRSPLSGFVKEWLPRDPTAAMLHLLQQQGSQTSQLTTVDNVWLSSDHQQALILAETPIPGLDLDAQQKVRDLIFTTFKQSAGPGIELIASGAPEIALQTRATIKHDAQTLSMVASLFMVAFMFWIYRSPKRVALTILPLAGGILMAAATVSLVFGNIHGITLAFGITVLGVAVDYPIHLLSHSHEGERFDESVRRIWPTLRLGVISTLLGYAAMAWTDFTGLAQLGIFSVAGLLSAALITRYLLPLAVPVNHGPPPRLRGRLTPLQGQASRVAQASAIFAVVCGAALFWQSDHPWSRDMAELSPIPAKLRHQEQQLRETLGSPTNQFMISVEAPSLEALLQKQERLMPLLTASRNSGEIGGFTLAAQLLSSETRQLQRRSQLPDTETLQKRLSEALDGLPFRPQTFTPFIEAVEKSRQLPPLTLDHLTDALRTRIEPLLSHNGAITYGMVRLSGVLQPDALQHRLQQTKLGGVEFIDIKQSGNALIDRFRGEALNRIAIAAALILITLWFGLGNGRRLLRVTLPVIGAVTLAAAVPLALDQPLNLFHLVSLLLVAGIGLDYSLFFSRPHREENDPTTLHALLICCTSTAVVFGILSLARIPVLQAIGLTVFTGVVAAFGLAWLFARSHGLNKA